MTTQKKRGAQVAFYANQWCFCSTRGIVHNGDFYYNTGSLDGNEIIQQFLDVISSYETVSVKIFGIASEGGGANAKKTSYYATT